MVERICPACQHGNPLDDRCFGKCGTLLERQLPVRRSEGHITIAGGNLPITWRQFGKTLALSVATIAAEAGISWLRRRVEAAPLNSSSSLARSPRSRPSGASTATLTHLGSNTITIMSQRIV